MSTPELIRPRMGEVLTRAGGTHQVYVVGLSAPGEPWKVQVQDRWEHHEASWITEAGAHGWVLEETGQRLDGYDGPATLPGPRVAVSSLNRDFRSAASLIVPDEIPLMEKTGKRRRATLDAFSFDGTTPWVIVSIDELGMFRLEPHQMQDYKFGQSQTSLAYGVLSSYKIPDRPAGVLLRHRANNDLALFDAVLDAGQGVRLVTLAGDPFLVTDLTQWVVTGQREQVTIADMLALQAERAGRSSFRRKVAPYVYGTTPGLALATSSALLFPGWMTAAGVAAVAIGTYLPLKAARAQPTITSALPVAVDSPVLTSPAPSEHSAQVTEQLSRIEAIGKHLYAHAELLGELEKVDFERMLTVHLSESLALHARATVLADDEGERAEADLQLEAQLDLIESDLMGLRARIKQRALQGMASHTRFLDAKVSRSELD